MKIVRILFVAAVMCCGLMGCSGPKDAGDNGQEGNNAATSMTDDAAGEEMETESAGETATE